MPFNVVTFRTKYKGELDAISRILAMNFDAPAQSIINHGFALMGVARFVGRDDRWEQYQAYECGETYTPPPAHLIRRWRNY